MLTQLLRFGLVGIVGLLVDLAVLHLAAPWLGWYGARALSFLIAASVTWGCNRRFTFAPGGEVSPAREYLRYLGSMIGGALLSYGAYVLVLQALGHSPGVATLGVATGGLAGMLLNFALARQLVFRTVPPAAAIKRPSSGHFMSEPGAP